MNRIAGASLLILAPLALSAPPAAAPSFEVASLKPHPLKPGQFMFTATDGSDLRIQGNTVRIQMTTVSRLLMSAYNVKSYQVEGVPAWDRVRDQVWDLDARTSGETTPPLEQVRLMLQTLLADRCQLKIHHDTRELPVYELVAGKGGPKFKESAGPQPPATPDFSGGVFRFDIVNRSINDLISIVARTVDRPVLDKTGLTALYDFKFEYSRDNPDGGQPGGPQSDRSIFGAMERDLGLKLVPAKEPATMIVIDHLNKPSAN